MMASGTCSSVNTSTTSTGSNVGGTAGAGLGVAVDGEDNAGDTDGTACPAITIAPDKN